MYLLYYLYGHGVELLPAGMVGKSDHEVIVAWVDVGRNLDIYSGIVLLLTRWDGIIAVVNPRILGLLLRIQRTVGGSSTMSVVVKVVVNLDVVVAQFMVVGHNVVEGDDVPSVVLLTVNRVGCDTLVADDGLLHVFLHLVIAAAARTECAQQHDGINRLSSHIVFIVYSW